MPLPSLDPLNFSCVEKTKQPRTTTALELQRLLGASVTPPAPRCAPVRVFCRRLRAAFDLMAGYLSLLRYDARAALDGRLSAVLSSLCEALEFDEDFNVQVNSQQPKQTYESFTAPPWFRPKRLRKSAASILLRRTRINEGSERGRERDSFRPPLFR